MTATRREEYIDRVRESTRALADRTLQVENFPAAVPVTAETTKETHVLDKPRSPVGDRHRAPVLPDAGVDVAVSSSVTAETLAEMLIAIYGSCMQGGGKAVAGGAHPGEECSRLFTELIQDALASLTREQQEAETFRGTDRGRCVVCALTVTNGMGVIEDERGIAHVCCHVAARVTRQQAEQEIATLRQQLEQERAISARAIDDAQAERDAFRRNATLAEQRENARLRQQLAEMHDQRAEQRRHLAARDGMIATLGLQIKALEVQCEVLYGQKLCEADAEIASIRQQRDEARKQRAAWETTVRFNERCWEDERGTLIDNLATLREQVAFYKGENERQGEIIEREQQALAARDAQIVTLTEQRDDAVSDYVVVNRALQETRHVLRATAGESLGEALMRMRDTAITATIDQVLQVGKEHLQILADLEASPACYVAVKGFCNKIAALRPSSPETTEKDDKALGS